ncbi:hypothetical protein DI487_04815 [Flavobacterium sediminis]|uniref:Uncharacterized protein n=1 Tax=Flavobacterium sediminis TaxID=2201181 RepID=A0A2U8QSW4_9FLAO|nr:hypothetical protein DI487_04815 [Flavobacterium sediminis]
MIFKKKLKKILISSSSAKKNSLLPTISFNLWSHLGSNQGPPDYETVTNVLQIIAFLCKCLKTNDLLILIVSFVFRFLLFSAKMFDLCLTSNSIGLFQNLFIRGANIF